MALIGITGGIGVGKSIVSRILRLKGYAVYDCDSEAKRLMDNSRNMIDLISSRFGEECILSDGSLNRSAIAKRVFTNEDDLRWLNSLVHSEVRKDLLRWSEGIDGVKFVESAILHSSRLDELCEKIWIVDAPEDIRFDRALRRGGITKENLVNRMDAQREELNSIDSGKCEMILNYADHSLLEQIDEALNKY